MTMTKQTAIKTLTKQAADELARYQGAKDAGLRSAIAEKLMILNRFENYLTEYGAADAWEWASMWETALRDYIPTDVWNWARSQFEDAGK